MEEKLDKFVTESNNSVNTELSGQLMKEKNQSMQRLEELVKEQKGKIDQLTEETSTSRQQIDELQVCLNAVMSCCLYGVGLGFSAVCYSTTAVCLCNCKFEYNGKCS